MPVLTQPCVVGQTCASVAVSVGANGIGGGLAGFNSGTITNAFATGDVTGAAGTSGFTTLGGLAGVNLGSDFEFVRIRRRGKSKRCQSSGRGLSRQQFRYHPVVHRPRQRADRRIPALPAGSSLFNSVGGAITSSQASGNVTVGTGSVAGSLVGANNGTISGRLYRFGHSHGHWRWLPHGRGTAAGRFTGTGSGAASNPPSLSPSTLLPPFSPELASLLALQGRSWRRSRRRDPQSHEHVQLAALNTAPVFNTSQGGIRLPPQQAPGPAPGTADWTRGRQQFLPPGFDRRIIDIPPPTETRFVKDEVMVQIRTDIGVERLRRRGRAVSA